jgi:ribose transport system permease protein
MTTDTTPTGAVDAGRFSAQAAKRAKVADYLREYAVLILLVALFIVLSFSSSSFLTPVNLLNIANQNVPVAIVAVAGTFVIISGGFDLSTGAIFGIVNVLAAWIAVNLNVWLGLGLAPAIGLTLGAVNGILITRLKIHSFLATLASSLAYRAIAVLITGGALISVVKPGFSVLGRNKVGGVYWAVIVLVVVVALGSFLLNRTSFGRYVFAVGGNQEAAELSGVAVNRVRVWVFAISGMAAGTAAAIGVSRISSGQPLAGTGLELSVIAAVILGGTSIYGGIGAIWRSLCGVYLIALIGNGFNILNVNPLYKDLVTGVIILSAVALSAADRRRR